MGKRDWYVKLRQGGTKTNPSSGRVVGTRGPYKTKTNALSAGKRLINGYELPTGVKLVVEQGDVGVPKAPAAKKANPRGTVRPDTRAVIEALERIDPLSHSKIQVDEIVSRTGLDKRTVTEVLEDHLGYYIEGMGIGKAGFIRRQRPGRANPKHPRRKNTHLIKGATAKFSQSHLDFVRYEGKSGGRMAGGYDTVGGNWGAKNARFIILEVHPNSYTVMDQDTGKTFSLGDTQLVRSISTTRKFPGTGYRGKTPRRNPSHGTGRGGMSGAVFDLVLFIENDGDLYRQQTKPIIMNLARKMHKGTFDKSKAPKLFQYLADAGAKKINKAEGYTARGYGEFTPEVRREAAKQLLEGYMENIEWEARELAHKKKGTGGHRKNTPKGNPFSPYFKVGTTVSGTPVYTERLTVAELKKKSPKSKGPLHAREMSDVHLAAAKQSFGALSHYHFAMASAFDNLHSIYQYGLWDAPRVHRKTVRQYDEDKEWRQANIKEELKKARAALDEHYALHADNQIMRLHYTARGQGDDVVTPERVRAAGKRWDRLNNPPLPSMTAHPQRNNPMTGVYSPANAAWVIIVSGPHGEDIIDIEGQRFFNSKSELAATLKQKGLKLGKGGKITSDGTKRNPYFPKAAYAAKKRRQYKMNPRKNASQYRALVKREMPRLRRQGHSPTDAMKIIGTMWKRRTKR